MRREATARVVLGATSALVTAGLVLQLILAIRAAPGSGPFESTGDRIVTFFSFFTVLSNIAVAVTTGMLVVRLDRRSTFFRVMRLDGLVAIAVTGLVFHLTLANLQELTGWHAAADTILHTLSPIACVLGWLACGPRRQVSGRIVLYAIVAPILWLVYALVRGANVRDRNGNHYYPYPFLNVAKHGYPVVLTNVALVALLFLAVSFGALALDGWLARRGLGARSDEALAFAPFTKGDR